MKVIVAIIVGLIVGAASTYFLMQSHSQQQAGLETTLASVREENETLQQKLAEATRDKPTQAEVERLRADQNDTLKLRAEVVRLKQDLTVAKTAAAAAAQRGVRQDSIGSSAGFDPNAQPGVLSVAPLPENNPAVAVHKTPILQASVGTNTTLLVGGWVGESGKRVFAFIQPSLDKANPNQVGLTTAWLEVSDDVAKKMRFGSNLDASGEQTATFPNFSMEQLRREFDQAGGGDLISSQPVSTGSGQQARLGTSESRELGGSSVDLGHKIDVIPTIGQDGTIQLSVRAAMVESKIARPAQ